MSQIFTHLERRKLVQKMKGENNDSSGPDTSKIDVGDGE